MAVPLHTPPRLRPEAGKKAFAIAAGWAALKGPGLDLSGPGGGWEFASASPGRFGAAAHAEAYILGGTLDPSGSGRLKTTGMASSVEGDLLWAPSGPQGPWRLYLGAQAALSILSIASTRSIFASPGATAIEPSGAYSLMVGFPVGASVGGSLGRNWAGQAGAHLAAYASGITFYHYFLRGPHLYGRTQAVSPHVAAGGHIRVEYAPWRLSLEAGGSVASRSGNSRGLSGFWTQAAWRLF